MNQDPFKPFEGMTAEDYACIGLRAGLEVHRQLRTRTKLFCRCPAGRYSDRYDAEILRHMRPTLSELGEYDGTALMEKKTRKNIYYRIHNDTVCTYEFDDTPPFLIAADALDVALEIALLLRLNMVGELHIARKQYLDGSIPTGFQRTAILGVDGWIPYGERRIRIRQLSVEEDSCREVSDEGHDRVYLTDRLGTPLIEVVTEPDMHTPQETAEVCQIIRRLCRSTGKVRTGYGAAREDVNVSVTGGTRVEIKGVPQIGRIPRLVYNEARRQWSLLRIRDELLRRGVTADTLHRPSSDVTGILAKTLYEPLRMALSHGHGVRCVVLPGFRGLLNESVQEHTTFAREFSDRIRVIACLSRLPNMAHSDTASESLYGRDWQRLRKTMRAGDNDALILVWGPRDDAQLACDELLIRAQEATLGIPRDTRQAFKDDTTGFERVLPGAERMYPDTDLPPLAISDAKLSAVRNGLPPYVWEREARLRELGVPEDAARDLCMSPRAELFFRMLEELSIPATFAAVVLCQRLKALQRAGLRSEALPDEVLYGVFQAFTEGHVAREGVVKVIRFLLEANRAGAASPIGVHEALQRLELNPMDEATLREHVTRVVAAQSDRVFPTAAHRVHYLMGVLMDELIGRVDGRRLATLVAKEPAADHDRDAPLRMAR